MSMNVNGKNISGSEGIQPLKDKTNTTALPSRESTPVEEKTEDTGLSVLDIGEEGKHLVFTPQHEISHSVDQTLLENFESVALHGLHEVKEEIESMESAEEVTEIEEQEIEYEYEERTPALASVEKKWLGPIVEYINEFDNQTLYGMIKERRSEINETKNNYLEKQLNARENGDTIAKEIASLEEEIKTNPNSDGISVAKERLNTLKAEQSFIGYPEKEKEIKNLLNKGAVITAEEGGKSGVYSLRVDGKRQFIIKPMDEEMMALNNPKAYALPYSAEDVPCSAKPGIPVYSALTNGELGSLVAKELGMEGITPRCYVMAIKSDQFADITDGMNEEEKKELIENGGMPDKEKLCLVQEFIPNCKELGTHILDSLVIDQKTLMTMEYEDREAQIKDLLKAEISHSMYEKAALFTWIIGEKDGNAGNFLISELDSKTQRRDLYKIDCAASFPENNADLTSGLSWANTNYENDLSENIKKTFNDLNTDNIVNLMISRNKSESAINALKSRIEFLKNCINDPDEEWAIWNIDQGLDELT